MTSRGSISLPQLFAAVTTLALAWLVTAAPATAQQAYITNAGDGTVSVINTATDTVVATVTVGTAPIGVAVSPDGLKVYVANSTGGSVSVINAVTNTVVATVPINDVLFGVAITPDGKTVFVTGGRSLYNIDTATNTVTHPVPAGGTFGVLVTPDGKETWAASERTPFISVSNATTNALVAVVDLTAFSCGLIPVAGGSGIAALPDSTTVFEATLIGFGGQIGLVSVIDAKNHSCLENGVVGASTTFGVAVLPAGSNLSCVAAQPAPGCKPFYVSGVTISGTGTVFVLDYPLETPGFSIATKITVGNNPKGIAVTPDGKKLYVANQNDNTVSVIDTATNKVTATINVGTAPWAFGKFIAPVALFAGTPGFPNCHGRSVSALAQKYGGMAAAATALGVSSVSALQNAIDESCGTATQ